ncbi:MAG: hypothetical protein AAB388_02050 [Patescibacteria group bacterium]
MKLIALLAIIAVIVGGFVFFTLFDDASPDGEEEVVEKTSGETATPPEAESEPEVFAGSGTLAELQALGKNIECAISYTPNEHEAAVTGTYFIGDGQVRGDFLTPSPDLDEDMVSSVIIEGTNMYAWSTIADATYGVKADLTLAAANSESSDGSLIKTPVPSTEPVRYDCKTWTAVDGSVFVPPSDVLFKDAAALQGAGMEYGTLYNSGEF